MARPSEVLLASADRYRVAQSARVSRVLHNQLGQILTVAGFQLEGLRSASRALAPQVEAQMEALQSTLEQALEQVRDLMYETAPDIAEKLGLQKALQRLVARLKQEAHQEIECVFVGGDGSSTGNATPLYRIAEESLRNALQHSDADRITMKVRHHANGSVLLEIQDNGKGFNVSRVWEETPGAGLVMMRHWATIHGLDLSLSSEPGRGVLVRVLAKAEFPRRRPGTKSRSHTVGA